MKKCLIIALLPSLLVGCNGSTTSENNGNSDGAIKVETIKIAANEITSSDSYIGVVEQKSTANLSFAVTGTISKILVSKGDRVTKGALLMQLSAPNTEETLTAAKSTYDKALDGFSRAEKLYNSKSMPELDFMDAQTKLQQAKSALAIAQKNVEYTSLYAPYSGVIGSKIATIGEVVLPSVPVLSLLSVDNVAVKIAVPEQEISTIRVGDSATISIGALGSENFRGVVISHGVLADPVSHTYEVMVSIENKSRDILPGMIASVAVEREGESLISVPNRAVILGSGTDRYVWVVESGKAEQRKVVVDGLSRDGVVITDGLNLSDEVIIGGYQKVSQGSKVEVVR